MNKLEGSEEQIRQIYRTIFERSNEQILKTQDHIFRMKKNEKSN